MFHKSRFHSIGMYLFAEVHCLLGLFFIMGVGKKRSDDVLGNDKSASAVCSGNRTIPLCEGML